METNRAELLAEASSLVNGDRNVTYGDPMQDFSRTASYWNIHIAAVLDRELQAMGFDPNEFVSYQEVIGTVSMLLAPHDVAIMMMQLKHSRLAWSPEKKDHWVDSAGYAACGWDCVVRENDGY